jgi:2-polyprenyl-3-methyl-5-hydroxy-6-metoxy-1,4-benzoquinol methylase
MRPDSQDLESGRMTGITLENYPWVHERHRIFPDIFENRNHKEILDISAGIGLVAKNTIDRYQCNMYCNEIDETCVSELRKLPVKLSSFDLDTGETLPLPDSAFDAVICLATLEHLVNLDHFITELHRILRVSGRLYISVPNYASLYWMIPLLRGRTFHDPFGDRSRYEFYAHIRYFTYQTLVEFMAHFGFTIDTVYLTLPKGSTKFQNIRARSTTLAFMIQKSFGLLYHLSPRWHQEPVICFAKGKFNGRPRKVIL